MRKVFALQHAIGYYDIYYKRSAKGSKGRTRGAAPKVGFFTPKLDLRNAELLCPPPQSTLTPI